MLEMPLPESAEELTNNSISWNIADGYVRVKIFKLLWLLDKYEFIALYGSEELEEFLPPDMVNQRRLEGLYRMKDTLKMLFENIDFIIHKEDRRDYQNLRRHVDVIEKYLSGCYHVEENQQQHTQNLVINEEHFNVCLKALRRVKEDINRPLNNCGIIFRQSDDMNIDDIMKDIVEGG